MSAGTYTVVREVIVRRVETWTVPANPNHDLARHVAERPVEANKLIVATGTLQDVSSITESQYPDLTVIATPTPPSEIRASELTEGDTYAEYGMDPVTIKKLDHHGDRVLVTSTEHEEISLDSDDVVELNPEEDA